MHFILITSTHNDTIVSKHILRQNYFFILLHFVLLKKNSYQE